MSDNRLAITDNISKFTAVASLVHDKTLAVAAVDILRLSKQQAPHRTGALWSSGIFERKGICNFEISYNTPYARRWEYETPRGGFREGRKSHYLGDPADMIVGEGKLEKRLHEAAAGISI